MNLVAIFVAALANFIIGFLFHGPLFGKYWMKLANIHPTGKEKFSDMLPQLGWNYLANLVLAFVMSGAFMLIFTSPFMGPATWYRGAITAAWLWLGFIATSTSIEVIWMGRSVKLWLFECVASLVSLSVMGAIIAAWM